MTYEQKYEAIKALCDDIAVRMRAPGDWYCTANIEKKPCHGSWVIIGTMGNGRNPQQAVEEYWNALTTTGEGYLVLNAGNAQERRHVRWNGFMWQDVTHIYPVKNSA